MTRLELLRCMRTLLSDKKSWTKGTYARYKNGVPVGGRDGEGTNQKAERYCLLGALQHCSNIMYFGMEHETAAVVRMLAEIIPQTPDPQFTTTYAVAHWNDSEQRKHSEVLELLDKAIADAV